MLDVLTQARLEAGGGNAITAMVSQKIGKNPAAHPEIGMRPAVGAFGFGQGQAHGAEQAQSAVFPGTGSHGARAYHGPQIAGQSMPCPKGG